MDSTMRPTNRVRLNLEVSPELSERLEEIARELGTSKSDAVRKAITLLGVAADAKEHGRKLYVSENPPVGTSQEIVGI